MMKFVGYISQFLLEATSDSSSKGIIIVGLALLDAYFLACSVAGKNDKDAVRSWPMFWVSIGLLFFILWYSNN